MSLLAASAPAQTPPGTIRTIAGPVSFSSGDGGQAIDAHFRSIGGFRFDPEGNMYIANYGNQRIRKVTPGGIVSTIAGTGVPGFSGDGGPAINAQLSSPVQVSPDNQGNVYILDGDNRVRKIAGALHHSARRKPTQRTAGSVTKRHWVWLGSRRVRQLYWMNGAYELNKISASGARTSMELPISSLIYQLKFAVDGFGDVFIVPLNGEILEVTSGGIIFTGHQPRPTEFHFPSVT